jgi:hypothetical protein
MTPRIFTTVPNSRDHVRHLFDATEAAGIKARLAQLRPESPRQWGRMNVAQALAHCSRSMEMALGDRLSPRMLIGRAIGRFVKPVVLGDDKPMKRNSPTTPDLVVADAHELDAERTRLTGLVDRFVTGGPAACSTHPHAFFGRLTPDEWSILMFKHLDHHLRQFGA